MARNNKPEPTETPAVEAPVEPTPAVEAPATETPAAEGAAAEGTEAPATEAPAAVEDLTAFKAAVVEAYKGADKETGTVAPVFVEPVVKEFRTLSTKARREGKKFLQEMLREGVMEQDLTKAKVLMFLTDQVDNASSTKAATKERTPVDPTEAFTSRAVALRLGADVFTETVPEGVAEDWKAKANKLYTDLKAQTPAWAAYLKAKAEAAEGVEVAEPEGVHEVVKAAFRVASGKGGGLPKAARAKSDSARSTFDGPRRDIKKHILSAFADQPVGKFLTVAEIKSHKSEEYGDDEPSSGAISARLFPPSGKVTVEGIEAVIEGGKKGARKI